jgi:hypothetical protein
MPWFKVDDKLHDHRKTRKALRVEEKRRDAAAMGLWVLAGSWCADNLHDGFVPADELYRWDDQAEDLAQRLVAAGYWEPGEKDAEQGFWFVNWPEHQPMKADVEAKREAARERMRAVRATPKKRSPRVRANSKGTTKEVRSTPTRPDPTPAAAAASVEDTEKAPRDLPPAVAILRATLDARKLTVRWDRLTADELTEIEALIAIHGDSALVKAALAAYQPAKPPVYAKAWLGGWRALRTPDQGLALVESCPQPGHSGTTKHCTQCASEQKAANR